MRPPNFFVALSAFNPSKYSGRVANHSHVKIKSLFVPSLAAAMMYLGLYAGNAEISDTANLLIFEACLAVVDEYVYGAVSENLSVPAM